MTPLELGIPVAATTDVAEVLTDLFLVLLAAKLGHELFAWIRQPTVIGEILGGVIVGPSVLGVVDLSEVFEVFSELGVVFLLFWVGLETRLSEMREVGRPAFLAGLLGGALPFAAGLALGLALDRDISTSLFIGAALVATSIGITSAVLVELGVLNTRPSRTILGAGVVDDIVALIVLAVAAGVATSGDVDVAEIAITAALALGFVGFFAVGGTGLMQARPRLLHAPRFSDSPLMPAVLICLGLAAFAAAVGLAAIIGAFLAGMIVAETREQHPIEEEVAPLYAFFPPFFFAFIGASVDLSAFLDVKTDVLLLVVFALAAATKFAGAYIGARSLGNREAAFVGVGMVPRGEMGIVIAGIGEATGVVGDELFAVIVGMSILTTLAVPPLLRRLAPDERPDTEPAPAPT